MTIARGDIVTAAAAPYSAKPRPVLVIQNSAVATGESVVIIPFTSQANPAVETRVEVQPTTANGLNRQCWLEVDKVSAIRSSSIGESVGVIEPQLLTEVEVQLALLLGLPMPSE
ncbi:MAG: type II toxin-antitoxin system PemK/MazF family toxin [Propionibacteriaceae bacterium]|nr:type II toxin-antitoxin system PemK/MazF family toxin [Propionibacteriaceae bacterium]